MVNQSEVAQILDQIRLEYEAARAGLSGMAQGVPRHVFITAHMEKMGELHENLNILIGVDKAIILVANHMDETPN